MLTYHFSFVRFYAAIMLFTAGYLAGETRTLYLEGYQLPASDAIWMTVATVAWPIFWVFRYLGLSDDEMFGE